MDEEIVQELSNKMTKVITPAIKPMIVLIREIKSGISDSDIANSFISNIYANVLLNETDRDFDKIYARLNNIKEHIIVLEKSVIKNDINMKQNLTIVENKDESIEVFKHD